MYLARNKNRHFVQSPFILLDVRFSVYSLYLPLCVFKIYFRIFLIAHDLVDRQFMAGDISVYLKKIIR